MEKRVSSVVVCGVGGQGVLIASEILARVLLESGFSVKKSEVHGMAQRGGCVVSFVRFSKDVSDFSPLVPLKSADLLIAFEKLEALRYINYASKDATIIVNDLSILPTTTLSGDLKYPEVDSQIRSTVSRVYFIPAYDISCNLGNPKFTNTFMLGVVSKFFNLDEDCWIDVLKSTLKRYIEENIKAFKEGRYYKLNGVNNG